MAAAGNKNRHEYEKRVNRVLDHVRLHRADQLSLVDLAAVAGFSPFHFHRIFKSMTGENLKEHIQRTRLESAASTLLTRPHVDVLEIALDNGFSSASAFARVFRERFGMTASAWRRGGAPHRPGAASGARDTGLGSGKQSLTNSKLGTAKGKGRKAGAAANPQDVLASHEQASDTKEDIMDVKVQNLPGYNIAYVRSIGPYGPAGGIQEAWNRLVRWATARDLWNSDRVCLGISHDDPRVTEPARCRYDAAIVVPPGLTIDGGLNAGKVEGGKYAMAPFKGTAWEIAAAFDRLFGGWLPQSGYQPDNRLIFELYRGDFGDETTGIMTCDLCVPVRPL